MIGNSMARFRCVEGSVQWSAHLVRLRRASSRPHLLPRSLLSPLEPVNPDFFPAVPFVPDFETVAAR